MSYDCPKNNSAGCLGTAFAFAVGTIGGLGAGVFLHDGGIVKFPMSAGYSLVAIGSVYALARATKFAAEKMGIDKSEVVEGLMGPCLWGAGGGFILGLLGD